MTDQRFEDQLAAFLRWQSAQTAGAPSAVDVALRLPSTTARTGRNAWRTAFAMAAVVAGLALAAVVIALVGASRPAPTLTAVDGPVAFYGASCGLSAADPVTGKTEVIAGPVEGCPSGPRATGTESFIGLTYDDVAGSADGRLIVYGRTLFCGGCGSTPTPIALAAQGAYVYDRETDVTERLDDCLSERCRFRLAISPDGRYIAFTQERYQDSPSIEPTPVTIVDRQADRRTVFVGRQVTWLAWAHDSRSLAVVQTGRCDPTVTDPCSSLEDEVVVTTPDGATRRQVATLGSGTTLTWAPDDRSLLTINGTPYIEGVPHLNTSMGRIDLASRERSALFAVDADPETARWSPDATHLAYRVSDASGEHGKIHILDMTGLDIAPPSTNDAELGPPIWSPSGDAVLFDGSAIPTLDAPAIADSYILHLVDGRMSSALATTGVSAWLPGQR